MLHLQSAFRETVCSDLEPSLLVNESHKGIILKKTRLDHIISPLGPLWHKIRPRVALVKGVAVTTCIMFIIYSRLRERVKNRKVSYKNQNLSYTQVSKNITIISCDNTEYCISKLYLTTYTHINVRIEHVS